MYINLTEFVNSCWRLIHQRNQYTGDHCRTVGLLSGRLAKELNLEKEIIDDIQLAGKIHDFGKILWEDPLLFGGIKRSQLSDVNRRAIQEHPTVTKDYFWNSLCIERDEELCWLVPVWFHHWGFKEDFRQYPDPTHPSTKIFLNKIKNFWSEEKVEIVIGIIKVADCFHAGVAGRIYREEHPTAKDVYTVIEEIVRDKGRIYHPTVAEALQKNAIFLKEEFIPSIYPVY